MRKRLTRIGNSWGVILSREVLELLEIEEEIEMQVVGNLLIVSSPEMDSEQIEAALAYLIAASDAD